MIFGSFSAVYRGQITAVITGRGPPCSPTNILEQEEKITENGDEKRIYCTLNKIVTLDIKN